MADLPAALKLLAPVDWPDVPQDDLSKYMSVCFDAGELLCNSVPPPPNGTPFESSTITNTVPNAAKSAAEMHSSSARSPARFSEHEELQKRWGKPMKFNKKDNPLDIALYKMAGHDRNGAWFARHNVLEGMGFAKFKKAMRREFPETLLEQGEPGAGAKRGLSADRRVERKVEGMGQMEVLQLSAQMPSPVSPREFVTLLFSTDDALSEKSAVPGGDKYIPRHFMIVSKPLDHPDTPDRSNFVKGRYESVEMIREIPLHAAKGSRQDDNLPSDPELNPVEWIMITRSDPGGGIPRFLVDRGTPEAMLGDVTKFLDWACPQEEIPDADADDEKQQETSEQTATDIQRESTAGLVPDEAAANERADVVGQSVQPETTIEGSQGGLMSTLTSTAAAYTPAPVSNFVEKQIFSEKANNDDPSDSSDTSSMDSFVSAEMRRLPTAPEYPQGDSSGAAAQSAENLSIRSTTSDISHIDKKNMSQQDKEVAKLLQQREKLDRKLAKKRAAEEERFKQSEQKEESERGKAKERMEKELKKTEDRHKKEMEKLDARRDKEAKKAEQRRQKREDQGKLSLVARERDEARSQLELFKRENGLLSDQVELLQRENTALATKLGKVGGSEVLKAVQEEVAAASKASGSRKRGRTPTSSTSKVSLDSGGSGEKKE